MITAKLLRGRSWKIKGEYGIWMDQTKQTAHKALLGLSPPFCLACCNSLSKRWSPTRTNSSYSRHACTTATSCLPRHINIWITSHALTVNHGDIAWPNIMMPQCNSQTSRKTYAGPFLTTLLDAALRLKHQCRSSLKLHFFWKFWCSWISWMAHLHDWHQEELLHQMHFT